MKISYLIQFLLTTLITTSICSAQIQVEMTGGANYSFLNLKYDDGDEEEKHSCQKLGIMGGMKLEIPVVSKWSFETGIFYNTHGGSFNNYTESVQGGYFVKDYSTERFDLKYLTIPIHIRHFYQFRNGLVISGSVGQFMSIGIGSIKYTKSGTMEQYDTNGHLIDELNYNEVETEKWKEFGFDRVHCGVGCQAGIEYKRFQFSGYYNLGLSSIINLRGYSMKGNTTGLLLAYRLRPK